MTRLNVTVVLACMAGGIVLGSLIRLPGVGPVPFLGFLAGTAVGLAGVRFLRAAEERDERARARARIGRPLPNPVHRLVLAGAREEILTLGWSPMAAHGRSDNPHGGICSKAAIQRAAAKVLDAGLVLDVRLADQVNAAFGRWIEDHDLAPAGWVSGTGASSGYGALPPWWNDSQLSREHVLSVFARAAGMPPALVAGDRPALGDDAGRSWADALVAEARELVAVPR